LDVIVSIAISRRKKVRKSPVNQASLLKDHGLEGNAHAEQWHRQVSLFASESIEKIRKQGLDVSCGDFAENSVKWLEK
jgi:MOSC domain-containing protein YiiM